MLCNNWLRSVIIRGGRVRNYNIEGRLLSSWGGRSLNAAKSFSYLSGCKFTTTRKMMVDSGAAAKGGPIGDVLPEKDDDGGYASGGWKR